jgi:choloylglycine hydrolase
MQRSLLVVLVMLAAASRPARPDVAHGPWRRRAQRHRRPHDRGRRHERQGARRRHALPTRLCPLTNSLPFDWQRINLGNFVNLSPVDVPTRRLGDVDIVNFGQGSGFIGLPGDLTPQSRFVRATLFSHWAREAKTAPETVTLGFHVLNTCDIFDGAVESDTANQTEDTKGFLPAGGARQVGSTDTTEWVVAHDRTNLKSYVRTYGGLKIQLVDFAKAGFDVPGLRTIDLADEFAPEDVSATATPLRPTAGTP